MKINPYLNNMVLNVGNLNNNVSRKIKYDEIATVTSEEKKYFNNLYPESHKEINEYHYYQKSGRLNGISIGTILDRRG